MKFINDNIDLSIAREIDQLQNFELNFIMYGVDQDLDKKTELLRESEFKLEAIRGYLSNLIENKENKMKNENKVTEYVKVHETEKNNFSLISTSRRCKILVDALPNEQTIVPLKYDTMSSKKYELKVDFITIDIAHGHSIKMEQMIKFLKENMPNTFIIAGNVSTVEAVFELEKWGADAIKVGIGPGCFIPTSEVKTLEGLKSLQNILIGDSVLTHKNRYKKVIDKHIYHGEQELLKINNLPPCTETHEFYVIEKSKKDLVNNENLLEFAFWIKAKDLDKNKHLLIKCE
jgi:hypothetical protein